MTYNASTARKLNRGTANRTQAGCRHLTFQFWFAPNETSSILFSGPGRTLIGYLSLLSWSRIDNSDTTVKFKLSVNPIEAHCLSPFSQRIHFHFTPREYIIIRLTQMLCHCVKYFRDVAKWPFLMAFSAFRLLSQAVLDLRLFSSTTSNMPFNLFHYRAFICFVTFVFFFFSFDLMLSIFRSFLCSPTQSWLLLFDSFILPCTLQRFGKD